MIRDPNVYLRRAQYFHEIAGINNELMDNMEECINDTEYIDDAEYIDDTEYTDDAEYTDDMKYTDHIEYVDDTEYTDDIEYMDDPQYVNDGPVKSNKNESITSNIKPCCRRYYDPITKHYYNIDRIFNPNTNGIVQAAKKNPDIWYPENKLSFKTIRDPHSGKYFRISKVYDTEGKYTFKCHPLNKSVVKKPGTNYYRPI